MNCNCCWFIQPDTAISRNRNGSRDFVMRKVTLSPDHRQCTALSAIPCCLCRSIFRTLRGRMSKPLAATVMVQEQLALALNRQREGERAEQILLDLIRRR